MDYYKLFDLPMRPVADNTYVAKKYVQLQKQFHPDFFTQEGNDEQEDMLHQSAEINKAYNIFKDGDKTLEYFLRHKKVITDDEKYALPPDFLMEVMEFNETMAEQTDEENRAAIAKWDEELQASVKDLLAHEETYEYTSEELEKLKEYFYKKKYLHRSLDRLVD